MIKNFFQFWKSLNYEYVLTKMSIWFFSAIISIAPIALMGFKDLSKNNDFAISVEIMYNYVVCSTDLIYCLVTLSTIVLSDIFCSIFIEQNEGKKIELICCLAHIITIIFGVLIYAFHETEGKGISNMESVNRIWFLFILFLSIISYINIATYKEAKEASK